MANSTSSHLVTLATPTDLPPPVVDYDDHVAPPPAWQGRVLRALRHATLWLLTLTIATLAVWGGLRLRRWTWELARPVHFSYDVRNGYGWGHTASGPEGYLNLYEKMVHQVDAKTDAERARWQLFLDYVPLRLAVMTWWGHHVREAGLPNPGQWRHDYAFSWPPLWFNAGMELIGAVSAFFLVRRWVIVSDSGPPLRSWPGEWRDRLLRRPAPVEPLPAPHRPFRGWWQGMAASLLFWFSPVAILNAHAWPTWDMWVPSMYLLALLAAAYGRWFWAGMAIGVGAMLKGQLFIAAPVFLAWTLLNGDWRNALRWSCGVISGLAVVASPWLVTYIPAETLAALYEAQIGKKSSAFDKWIGVQRFWNWPAIGWSAGVLLVAIALPFLARSTRPRIRYGGELLAVVLLQWPIFARFGVKAAVAMIAASAVVLLAARSIRRWPDRFILAAGATSAALLGGIHFFKASNAWWRCGVEYGTHHYPAMHMGAHNLPALMKERYGWYTPQQKMFAWAGHDVTVQQFTRTLFLAGMAICLWAVARQARRRDPRLLVALMAPWVVFFALPTQVHDRYLIYAATVAAICVGQSVGMALLGVVLMAISWQATVRSMIGQPGASLALGPHLQTYAPEWFGPTSGVTLWRNLMPMYPDVAWAVLLALLVTLYVAVTTTKRTRETPE